MAFTDNHTALVLVDPYRDFLSPDGKAWPLISGVAEAVDLRRHLVELLAAARAAGAPVVIAPHRRFHPGEYDGWQHLARAQRMARDQRLYEIGTTGAEWQPELAPRPGEVVCTEHRGLSGFAETDLDQQLRRRGITDIVLAGLTAPGCVEGTGRAAMELGYSVTLVKDATAAFDMDYMRAAVELNGPLYADAVVTTAELIGAVPVELVGQKRSGCQ
jgi:nicotinamidase-related amidase